MKVSKLLACALALVLLCGLCPAAALAEGDVPAQVTVEVQEPAESVIIFGPADAAAKFPDEAVGPVVRPVTVSAGETYYAAYEDTVYNNGGVVYNNGGLVYNNNGTVYNNEGVTYNNGGTVYANGGEVFSGLGQVIEGGGAVYDFATRYQEPFRYHVTLDADPSPFAELTGLTEEEGALWLEKDAICTVIPREGYHLLSWFSSVGLTDTDETGALVVAPSEELRLTLRFQADPPIFDKPAGTYGQVQALELTAGQGAEIYYWLSGEAGELDEAILYTAPILVQEGCSITAVAVAQGAEISEPATATYALLYARVPTFEPLPEGQEPAAQPLTLWTVGDEPGALSGVSLNGKDAESFLLQGPESLVVPAGESDQESFTLSPAAGLAPGNYEAEVVLRYDSGSSVSLPVSFQVQEAEKIHITVTVTHADGSRKEVELDTAADNLLDALLQAEGLVERKDEGFITVVDGEAADWSSDRAFWALSKDGVALTTGAHDTKIADGEHYELTYTKSR